jgi:hypothetical protein
MAAKRLSMRQIREILRQKWPLGLSHRAVAQSLGVGLGTISSVVARAQGAGLGWPQVQSLSDDVLEGRLYGRPDLAGQRQRPSEQIGVLSDECDLPAQVVEPIASEIVAPQADGAAVWVPEPQEQVGDRRLSRARRPDERDGAAGGHGQQHVDERRALAARVREANPDHLERWLVTGRSGGRHAGPSTTVTGSAWMACSRWVAAKVSASWRPTWAISHTGTKADRARSVGSGTTPGSSAPCAARTAPVTALARPPTPVAISCKALCRARSRRNGIRASA